MQLRGPFWKLDLEEWIPKLPTSLLLTLVLFHLPHLTSPTLSQGFEIKDSLLGTWLPYLVFFSFFSSLSYYYIFPIFDLFLPLYEQLLLLSVFNWDLRHVLITVLFITVNFPKQIHARMWHLNNHVHWIKSFFFPSLKSCLSIVTHLSNQKGTFNQLRIIHNISMYGEINESKNSLPDFIRDIRWEVSWVVKRKRKQRNIMHGFYFHMLTNKINN